MAFDKARMENMIRKIDGLDPDYKAKMHGIVTDALISYMNILERRISALEQNQPNIKVQGGSRTI